MQTQVYAVVVEYLIVSSPTQEGNFPKTEMGGLGFRNIFLPFLEARIQKGILEEQIKITKIIMSMITTYDMLQVRHCSKMQGPEMMATHGEHTAQHNREIHS